MENEKLIQSLEASNKEIIHLYTTYLEISSKKRLFKKKRQIKYSEIEKISLNISDQIEYVKSIGNFAALSFTIKKKGMIGFDFYEFDVRELKYQTSRIVAFVGSLKACIDALNLESENPFAPKIEIIEPEVLGVGVSYKQLIEENKVQILLDDPNKEVKEKESKQKLLK